MKKDIIVKLAFFLFGSILILGLNACNSISGGVHLGLFKGNASPKAQKVEKHGPPDHAKAYGRRAKHAYRYYPDVQVYFDIHRKMFFYLEGQGWRMSVTLPKTIKLTGYVSIEMDTDKPYKHIKTHKAKYPPGHMKKKKKQKWS